MAVFLSPVGGVAAQFFTNSGAVLTGGKLYTYAAGTTTPQATYTSNTGGTYQPNPIILDAAGRVPNSGEIWLTDGVSYKFVLKDSNDVLIATWDNIIGINSSYSNFISNQEIQTATSGQTVFTLANPYVVGANTLSVFVDGVNQYGPGATYAYYETGPNTVTFVSGLHVGASVKFTTVQTLTTTQTTTASLVSYTPAGSGAVATTVQAKLRQWVSVTDFGAKGDGITDDTTAFNNAFAASSSVFIPQGTYIVGALLFGSQSTTGQSSSPQLLYGEGWDSVLKAKAGFTGTILKAWSIAGVQFKDFAIDGNGTATIGIDTTWKPSVGPSTQNRYQRIRINNVNGTSWQAKDNNDSVFDEVVVNSLAQGNCAIDFVASGGLGWLNDCIWNNGYLRFGVQNGVISNSWGHGISFAQNCVNYVGLNGCYLYSNTAMGCVLSSESFASFQSVGSLTCTATQFIGSSTAFFNLNALSTLDFYGCQWVGSTTTMFGVSCRSDSYATVKVLFRGGSVYNALNINQPTGFIIEQSGLMNLDTGLNKPNKMSSIYASGENSGTFNSGTFYDFIAANTLEEGTYIIEWYWNHNTSGQPYIIRASALMSVLAIDSGVSTGVSIPTNIATYFTDEGGTIVYRLVGTSSGQKVQFCWTHGAYSTNLNSPGSYTWKAVKIM
jgi:hypothetical protein